jgi:nucleotide-binding universal stress UspA family protein
MSQVVVAYDGSEPAAAALDAVIRLFPTRPCAVVAVWDSTTAVAPASLLAIPAGVAQEACAKVDEASERQATELANEGAERLRAQGIEAGVHPLKSHGNTWSAIVAFAEQHDAEVVVVGSRGRSGVKSALLGSVSNGVVHHSSRPVLVVQS